jgi:hypothetical protein
MHDVWTLAARHALASFLLYILVMCMAVPGILLIRHMSGHSSVEKCPPLHQRQKPSLSVPIATLSLVPEQPEQIRT